MCILTQQGTVTMDSIKDYFKGKNIFVTGASGFVGKALIEKLLRSCPDLDSIYILLRPKKGKNILERVDSILRSKLFDLIRANNHRLLEKIVPIEGDSMELNLGISPENLHLLKSKIHIFFHVAASVRFDDSLKTAIFLNIRATREASLLALDMKKLESFMHVSTSYCNIQEGIKVVDEILYPAPVDWKRAIEVAEKMDERVLNVFCQKYTDGFENTYVFTKRLAEHCVVELLEKNVTTVICRPSVVISSVQEPFQGFIDNFNGPVGLLIAGGAGLLRIVYGEPNVETDYVAVDNVVKCMIASVWYEGRKSSGEKSYSIYHATSTNAIRFKLNQFVDYGKRISWEVPFEKKIWFPEHIMTKCWYNYYVSVLLFHLIPAIFLDAILRIIQYRPMFIKVQRKIYIANMAISPFVLNEWTFNNQNGLSLLSQIPSNEMREFNFRVYPLTENGIIDYYLQSADFARVNLLKENEGISESNKRRTKWMYYLHIFSKFILYTALMRLIIKMDMWNHMLSYWTAL